MFSKKSTNSTANLAASPKRGAATESPASSVHQSKTKVAERIHKQVETTVVDTHRSPELIPLTKQYEEFKGNLRQLLDSAKSYHQAQKALAQQHSAFVKSISELAKDSPLSSCGQGLDGPHVENLQQVLSAKTEDAATQMPIKDIAVGWEKPTPDSEFRHCSLRVLTQLSAGQSHVNALEFQKRVIEYVAEWESIVVQDVKAGLAKVKKLASDRSHYEKKVEMLRKKSNDLKAKEKEIPAAHTDKLKRNEVKLKDAFEAHEEEAGRLCVMIEEATNEGWHDLYPLIKTVMKWESNRASRDQELFGRMLPSLQVVRDDYEKGSKEESITSKKKKAAKAAKAEKKLKEEEGERLKSTEPGTVNLKFQPKSEDEKKKKSKDGEEEPPLEDEVPKPKEEWEEKEN